MKFAFALVSLCFLANYLVESTPNGAPAGVCKTMVPGHVNANKEPISGQTGASPYSIRTSSTSYKLGETFKVWIDGQYPGFLLEAREVNKDVAIGSWANPPAFTKVMNCSASGVTDAVTHSNTSMKTANSVYEWTPLSNYGNISFVATVAENHDVFWIKISSEVISNTASKISGINAITTLLSLLFSFFAAKM